MKVLRTDYEGTTSVVYAMEVQVFPVEPTSPAGRMLRDLEDIYGDAAQPLMIEAVTATNMLVLAGRERRLVMTAMTVNTDVPSVVMPHELLPYLEEWTRC